MSRTPPLAAGSEPAVTAAEDRSVRDDAIPVDPDAGTGPTPRPDRPWAHRRLDVLAVVAAGGAIGSVARYGISRAFPVEAGRFPTSTVAINMSGSFALGIVLVLLIERLAPTRYARAFLAVGVIGAFTTFSAFAVEAVQLAADHRPLIASEFVVVSVAGGLVAARLGIVAGRAIPHRHPPAPRHPREEST